MFRKNIFDCHVNILFWIILNLPDSNVLFFSVELLISITLQDPLSNLKIMKSLIKSLVLPSFFAYQVLTRKVFSLDQGYLQNPRFQLENIRLYYTCISTPNYLQIRIYDQVTFSLFFVRYILQLSFLSSRKPFALLSTVL